MNGQVIGLSAPRADDIVFVLEFVCDWLDYDYDRLDASLFGFNPGGIDITVLRGDLQQAINQLKGGRQ